MISKKHIYFYHSIYKNKSFYDVTQTTIMTSYSVSRRARDDASGYRLPFEFPQASRIRFAGFQLPPHLLRHTVVDSRQRVVR